MSRFPGNLLVAHLTTEAIPASPGYALLGQPFRRSIGRADLVYAHLESVLRMPRSPP